MVYRTLQNHARKELAWLALPNVKAQPQVAGRVADLRLGAKIENTQLHKHTRTICVDHPL